MTDSFGTEQLAPTETLVRQAVGYVDTYHTKLGDPKEPGKRAERCGDIAREVSRSANNNGIELPMAEAARIHRVFGGDGNRAFVHYLNVTPDLKYLVDLTFCQFIDGETGRIGQGSIGVSGMASEHPVTQGLLKDGFIPLTDETLRDYLDATATGDKSYIQGATVAGLAGQRLI